MSTNNNNSNPPSPPAPKKKKRKLTRKIKKPVVFLRPGQNLMKVGELVSLNIGDWLLYDVVPNKSESFPKAGFIANPIAIHEKYGKTATGMILEHPPETMPFSFYKVLLDENIYWISVTGVEALITSSFLVSELTASSSY